MVKATPICDDLYPMSPLPDIRRAESPDDLDTIRSLFTEYEEWLNIDLCFQDFQNEINSLPGKYAPPQGSLLLARIDGLAIGCVAMKPLDAGICEMKRLFVRPAWRGKGYGQALVHAILDEGRRAGYSKMWLDTLQRLREAIRLYREFGFYEIPAYYHNPLGGVIYMELDLKATPEVT